MSRGFLSTSFIKALIAGSLSFAATTAIAQRALAPALDLDITAFKVGGQDRATEETALEEPRLEKILAHTLSEFVKTTNAAINADFFDRIRLPGIFKKPEGEHTPISFASIKGCKPQADNNETPHTRFILPLTGPIASPDVMALFGFRVTTAVIDFYNNQQIGVTITQDSTFSKKPNLKIIWQAIKNKPSDKEETPSFNSHKVLHDELFTLPAHGDMVEYSTELSQFIIGTLMKHGTSAHDFKNITKRLTAAPTRSYRHDAQNHSKAA